MSRRALHGTDGGYYYEVRHGEVPCLPCCAAHSRAELSRRARQQQRAADGSDPRPPRSGVGAGAAPSRSLRPRRPCIDCGAACTGQRCRSCGAREAHSRRLRPVMAWEQRGGIWRAA